MTSRSAGVVEADVCIIGAGPAGISVACELAGSGLQIVVLESGGYGLEQDLQALSAGEMASSHHVEGAVGAGRRRQFGGTTNLWVYHTEPDNGRRYARSVPPERIDFEKRFGEPPSGWPLTVDAMADWYRRAQAVWNGGPFDYALERWAMGAQSITDADSRLVTRISQHGPSDVFSLRYRDDLHAAGNVQVLVACTATRLVADDAGDRIRVVEAVDAGGDLLRIRARATVLAAGGIENAQLLLSSPVGEVGAAGNQHDTVGRFLTDHPEFRMGVIVPAPEVLERLALYDLRWVDRFLVSGFLTLREEVKTDEHLLNLSAALVLHGRGFGSDAHRSLAAVARVGDLRASDLGRLGRSVVRSPGDAVRAISELRSRRYEEWAGGWSRPEIDRRRLPVVELHAAAEQSAVRENRVVLGASRDPLGRPRPRVEWAWSNSDRENTTRSIDIVSGELAAAGIGRVTRWSPLDGPQRPRIGGLHHPMGATRMHPDPTQGVVDLDCRVHGLENLFVAGSSVFSTGHGYANPTLTILALAIRLADHLRASLGTVGRAR